jgi:hypothetical protein
MAWLWAIAALLLLGAGYFLFTRARAKAQSGGSPVRGAGPKAAAVRMWGKRLIVPNPELACQAARDLNNATIPVNRAPPLPLAGCSVACQCRYQDISEQRVGTERRSGKVRREEMRFEAKERRSTKDRRKSESYKWDSTI